MSKENIITFMDEGVLHLWAFVTLVGVVTFVGETTDFLFQALRDPS